jgi:cytosine/adenosine deaminase-related metal-dependent hydrolase
MTQRLVLFAKTILPMDRPQAIEDGFVLIQGNRILQVGCRKDFYFLPSMRMLDLGDTILLPGLINAHCHLDFTSFKGKVPYRGNFREWLRAMAGQIRQTPPADFRKSIQKGIQDSLTYGTTTLCDISTSGESFPLLSRSGLRAVAFLELLDVAQPDPKAVWKGFRERLKLLIRDSKVSETFKWGVSPHTPFTVSKELLLLAGRHIGSRVLTTIHVAESRDEAQFFKKGKGAMAERMKTLNPDWNIPHGTTPVQYLNDCGWLPKLDLGIHLNLVNRQDLKLIAKNRVTVVHCPGSHAYFNHPSFGYRKMRRAGVSVCLGTDSLASNQSLSLFREMRLFQKANPQIVASEILAMATVKPAQALGEGKHLGQVKPGYFADLIGIPLKKKAPGNLYAQVIANRGPVCFSMVNGEIRLRPV